MIKALFIDFDGTLYSHATDGVPRSAFDAITDLRNNGVLVFLCTGRSLPELKQFDTGGIVFDGMILSNGQLIFDEHNHVIYDRPIDGILKEELIRMFNEKAMPVYVATKDELYLNYVNDFLVEVQAAISSEVPEVRDYNGEDFYTACVFIDNESARAEVDALRKHAEVTYWHEGAVDVVPYGVSKASGIDELLKMYGLDLSETMAFGDGENDVEMLKHCGIAVAMGNSPDFVKEVADFVTDDIDDDGFYKALKYYGLL
ncbi:MAG: Cof-type HAD-IIB family hydrolase [Erysipelotrichaceae bacterium]|nr:Cof-type HAD-IIB family hydrolase [Erysipelotrichaceae bacterium]